MLKIILTVPYSQHYYGDATVPEARRIAENLREVAFAWSHHLYPEAMTAVKLVPENQSERNRSRAFEDLGHDTIDHPEIVQEFKDFIDRVWTEESLYDENMNVRKFMEENLPGYEGGSE